MIMTIWQHGPARGQMKLFKSGKARRALLIIGAAGASALLVFLFDWVFPGKLGPFLGAFLAGLMSVPFFLFGEGGKEAEESRKFINVVGHSIDDIMIGAAETSYFVDSVKKQIEKDVQTAVAVVASSEQNAHTTERIAANVTSTTTARATARQREPSIFSCVIKERSS